MKKLLIASLALASVSAFAQSQTSGFDGFVSVGIGNNKISGLGGSDSSTMSNLRGSFGYTHASGFGLQIDNVIDNQEIGGFAKIRTNDLALHGFYRKDNYLVGVIHQTRSFKAKDGGASFTLPIDRTFTGFEGQYDFGKVTVYGLTARDEISVGFFGPGSEVRGRTNTLEARYFFNDNLRTDLTLSTSKFSDLGASSKTKTTAIGVEYKFNSMPLSAFAKYQNMNGTFADTKRVVVGVTLSLGKESLKARNGSGASLNPINVDNQLLGFFGSPV